MLLSSVTDLSRCRLSARHPANAGAIPRTYLLLLLLIPESSSAAEQLSPALRNGLVEGLAVGIVLAILIAVFARTRIKAAEHDLKHLQEVAEHCEHERNLAQQELVRRLEEERELAKEKMQFESQLSDYEKYASLAQLALGAAHEINNPLLGIMSHLELEWREVDDGATRGDRPVHRRQQAHLVRGARPAGLCASRTAHAEQREPAIG